MKAKFFLITTLLLALVASLVVTSVLAQQSSAPDSTGTLNMAVSLLAQGKPQAALTLLTNVAPTDVVYAQAKCYDALCLYALKDGKGFLKAAGAPEIQTAELPSAIREELEFDQVNTLFAYGKYDAVIPRAMAFQENYIDSSNWENVVEYLMASLFTQGMRDVYRACALGNDNEFQQSWLKGQTNLAQFMAIATTWGSTNYQTLPGHDLKVEVWTARIALGDETNLLQEVASGSPNDSESLSFLNVKLHKRLQPQAVGENLQRMADFVARFPDSKNCKQIRFDMADISFSHGEACMKAAEHAQLIGDSQTAASQHAKGEVYFNYTRSLTNDFQVDEAAGIDAANVFDRQSDFLHSIYWERDYPWMISEAYQIASNSVSNSLTWRMAQLYIGVGLYVKKPSDLNAAAVVLDTVVTDGFNGRVDHDHWTLAAMEWRIAVARDLNETGKRAELVAWVKSSNCPKNQKTAFLNRFDTSSTK